MAQQVKDPSLSLLRLWLHLWRGFNPRPGNFHVPWVQPKKKRKDLLTNGSNFYPIKKKKTLILKKFLYLIKIKKFFFLFG